MTVKGDFAGDGCVDYTWATRKTSTAVHPHGASRIKDHTPRQRAPQAPDGLELPSLREEWNVGIICGLV